MEINIIAFVILFIRDFSGIKETRNGRLECQFHSRFSIIEKQCFTEIGEDSHDYVGIYILEAMS